MREPEDRTPCRTHIFPVLLCLARARLSTLKTPEIVGLRIVEFQETTWKPISLLCERAYQITTAKVYFSDSVLCLSEMRGDPNSGWKNKITWYWHNKHLKELDRIGGMQTEFEWKIFLGLTTLGIFEEIQKLMKSKQCEPEHFNGRIIFMSMFHDIVLGENGNTEECIQNSIKVSKCARRFPCGRWSFLRPGSEKEWYKTCSDKPDGNWDRTAEMMILKSSTESGHPIFRASSAFERGELGNHGQGKKSMHLHENQENIELLLRTVISVIELSVCGALPDLCNGLGLGSSEDSAVDSSADSESSGTLSAKEV